MPGNVRNSSYSYILIKYKARMLRKISLLKRYEYVEIAIADRKNNPMAKVERDITNYLIDLGIEIETDPAYSPIRQPKRQIILCQEINDANDDFIIEDESCTQEREISLSTSDSSSPTTNSSMPNIAERLLKKLGQKSPFKY